MSTTNKLKFSLGLAFWLGWMVLMVSTTQGAEVAHRHADCVVLSATPTPIGTGSSRIDYYLHNSADSAGAMYCGYVSTVNPTPGAGADELSPGEGKHICIFADQVMYCMTTGGAKACFDESRMVTPTPTP